MRPNEGRLQTAEHLLSKILEVTCQDARVIVAVFSESSGRLEITTKNDPREKGRVYFERAVNTVIERNVPVKKHLVKREEAEKEFDLSRLPAHAKEVRVVEIDGFDRTPCKDPHVENTGQIGKFSILRLERSGRDRYRFLFKVE